MDSKKTPLEEELEQYLKFSAELHEIGRRYSYENEFKLGVLRDAIAKLLSRFVSDEEKKNFLRKTQQIAFVVTGFENERRVHEERVSAYLRLYGDIDSYLQSSIKAVEYALATEYLKGKSDAERRSIVLDRKISGRLIEVIETQKAELKRLRSLSTEKDVKTDD